MSNKELWKQAAELVGEQELSRRFGAWIRGIIKKELTKRKENASGEFFLDDATTVLNDLNERTGRLYRAGKENMALIRARLAEGYTVEEFRAVHRVMAAKWLGDDKMRDYVRPSTLYRPGHFGEYLALASEVVSTQRRGDTEGQRGLTTEKAEKAEEQREEAEKELARVMAREWWDFDSWADFMKWTSQLPDAKAIANYVMPDRIRVMRGIPLMMINVLKGKSPEWAEREYAEIKGKRSEEVKK